MRSDNDAGSEQDTPLTVALNAIALLSPLTGIGRYVAELAAALEKQGVRIRYFSGAHWSDRPPNLAAAAAAAGGWPGELLRRLGRQLPGARRLSRRLKQRCFDRGMGEPRPALYHDPNYLAYRFDGPTVITAHDASWVRHPETHPRERVRSMERMFPEALARAQRIIVDSDFVAGEMHAIFGVPYARLRTVYLGVAPSFRPLPPAQTLALCQRHGLAHGRYVLALGTLEPRKNLGVLLRAYRNLAPGLAREFPLVIAGMQGWRHGEVDREIGALERAGLLRMLGRVAEDDLPALYAAAAVFVYPSIYEGFGLPPLEAMKSGVPVIVADSSSLPEVVGEAGKRFEAQDADALAEILSGLLEDGKLRQGMAAAGIARAAGFTWERCAQQTRVVYAEAIATA